MRRLWVAAAAGLFLFSTGCAPVPSPTAVFSPASSFTPVTLPALSTPQSAAEPTLSEAAGAPTAPVLPTPSPTTTTRGTATSWTEDFDGPAGSAPDPTLFQYRKGGNGWGNQELETYTDRPQNAALDGAGQLRIQAIRETLKGSDGITRQWTSARLDSLDKWAFTTGTIAIRMKVPSGAGLWPAFWLEGTAVKTVDWPDCGEIDVVEALGGYNGVYQTVHGPNGTKAGYSYSSATKAPQGESVSGDFHVFSVTRTPGRIEFGIDGKLSGTITPKLLKKSEKWAFDGPMFLIVNLAVGGWPGEPTDQTPAKSSLLVDWIRYYPQGA